MKQTQKSNSSQSNTLVVLLAVFALLCGLYYSLRFGVWSMEGDTSSQTTAAIGILNTNSLENTSSYNNGYGYASIIAWITEVTGLSAQTIQLGSSLWVFMLAVVAFITYREFVGAAAVAGLGVLLLFLQPDFLFYIVRGGHEKFTWSYALLILFLLLRSYQHTDHPLKLMVYIGLFYFVFWGFASNNIYFAASFMGALLLSFIGGWMFTNINKKAQSDDIQKSRILQRLIIVSLACFIIVYAFINYSYEPGLQFYYFFTSLADKIGLMLLSTQASEIPQSYQVFGVAWRSQSAYLLLTGLQWSIGIISLVAWGMGLFRLQQMDHKRWLLWLMYSAFGFLLVFGVVADYAGFLNTNLQLRMFTPFALFSSLMAADLIWSVYQKLSIGWRKAIATGLVIIIVLGALAVTFKVTNDPIFGNQWFFYTPSELAPAGWMNRNGVQDQQVWVDTWEHLAMTYYFWEGFRPIIPYQYLWGTPLSQPKYTLISELARLRANRAGISLPETDEQNLVYDNGIAQIYRRLPLTPYQR